MSDTMWVKKSRVSASACHRAAHSSRKQHACCDVATDFVRNNFIRGYAGSMPAMTSIHSVTLGLLQLRLRYIPLCWPCICHAYATSHGNPLCTRTVRTAPCRIAHGCDAVHVFVYGLFGNSYAKRMLLVGSAPTRTRYRLVTLLS
jgi:hypothetical protein